MRWSFGYNPISASATVSNATSERSPDGLAANVVTRSGSSWGKSWVATAGATSKGCDFTLGSPILPGYVAVIGANYSDAAVVKLYVGSRTASPVELCTLEKCDPANIWIGKPAGSSGTVLSYSVSDAGAPAAGLETPLIVFGTRLDMDDAALGRPSSSHGALDLATQSRGQLGAVWTCEQVRQFRQAFQVDGHDAEGSLWSIRGMWSWCGRSRPILSCLDFDDPTHYGNTNFGLLEQDLTEALADGLMSSFPMSVLEMIG